MKIKLKYIVWGVIATIGLWLVSGLFIYSTWGEDSGMIGDMFGSINALFSGLALFGIIISILIQQEELRLQRIEVKQTRDEFYANRLTNILFKQLESLHEEVLKRKFNVAAINDHESQLQNINGFENILFSMMMQPEATGNMFEVNLNCMVILINTVQNYLKGFEKIVNNSTLTSHEKQQLKSLFVNSMNSSVKKVFSHYKTYLNSHNIISKNSSNRGNLDKMNYFSLEGIDYVFQYDKLGSE